jgi:hypothetical protein
MSIKATQTINFFLPNSLNKAKKQIIYHQYLLLLIVVNYLVDELKNCYYESRTSTAKKPSSL